MFERATTLPNDTNNVTGYLSTHNSAICSRPPSPPFLFDFLRMQQDIITVAGHQYMRSAGGHGGKVRERAERARRLRERRALRMMRQQYLDEEKMDLSSPLSCSASGFKLPRLRRCSFELDLMHFIEFVGGGLDGCIWKIEVPKGGSTLALKVVR